MLLIPTMINVIWGVKSNKPARPPAYCSKKGVKDIGSLIVFPSYPTTPFGPCQ